MTALKVVRIRRFGLYLLAALALASVIAVWASNSGPLLFSGRWPTALRSLSNLFAVLAVFLILMQVLLIGRIKWIETTFGLDKLSRWHHISGFTIPLFILIHPILLVASSSLISGRDWLTSFLRLIRIDDVLNAVIGASLFIVLVIISILIVYKKLKYEAWYFTHLVMYAAILLAFSHEFNGDDLANFWPRAFWTGMYVFVLANLLYFRFFLPIWKTWRHDFTVERVVQEPGDVTSIYINGRELDEFKVKAGQFFIFRFLDRKRWWQAHPFSLSCAPNGKYLRISARVSGDFTKELGSLKPGTKVYVDGPHGVFTADRSSKEKFLFIAGGIGITPIRSMSEVLAAEKRDVTLLYANRSKDKTTFKNELDQMAAVGNLKVEYVMSEDQAWKGESGFIDREKIQRLVPDFIDREVYLCGPRPMMTKLILELNELGVTNSQIHFEKFSL